jgi:hypothetical protein
MQRQVIALAAGLAASAAALVITATGGAQDATPQTLTFVEHEATSKNSAEIDNPPRHKFSTGDAFVFSGDVYDADNKVRQGTDTVACTSIRQRILCHGTFNLKGGMISVVGSSANDDFAGAVVGGTGAYVGARGTIAVKNGKKNSIVTFTLLP